MTNVNYIPENNKEQSDDVNQQLFIDDIIKQYSFNDIVNVSNIVNKSIFSSSITGSIITTGLMRTAIRNQRVEIIDNEINFYSPDNTLSGKIYGAGTEIQGGPWIFLTAKTYITTGLRVAGDIEMHGAARRLYFNTATTPLTWIEGTNTPSIQMNRDIHPSGDNTLKCGIDGNKWSDVRSYLINGADICLDNNWTFTENDKIGIKEKGIAILDENDNLQMFIGKKYFYTNKLKDIKKLKYIKTTQKERVDIASKK